MTDRERFNLRGPVKSCEIHRTWYSRACTSESCETEERTDTAVVEFLEDGSLQRHSQKNPAPVLTEWTHIYEYDVHGRLRALRSEEANIVHVVRRYEYDAVGRLSHLMVIDRDGNSRAAETYTYAADGTKEKVMHADPELFSKDYAFGLDGTDAAYGAEGTVSIKTQYDVENRPAEHVFLDAAGGEVQRLSLKYDDRGNMVEEFRTLQQIPSEMAAQLPPEYHAALRDVLSTRR